MRWADQSEQRLLDIERELDTDVTLRRDVQRLGRVMAVRQLAIRRRPLVAILAAVVGAVVSLVGLVVGASGPTGLTALATGGVLAAAVAFALLNAVLDHRAGPPSDAR
ncbi:MAG TPA: hypothetical protein VHF06_21785 [Pseudonocardiaceae bacterium]|jgi:hypothetical protein|nr:hypothetical protein [Pseudonocardiaceae bacterium]